MNDPCTWYVLRWPRSDSGPCGRRAKYLATSRGVFIQTHRVCGTHANSAATLGWEIG